MIVIEVKPDWVAPHVGYAADTGHTIIGATYRKLFLNKKHCHRVQELGHNMH